MLDAPNISKKKEKKKKCAQDMYDSIIYVKDKSSLILIISC